MGKGEKMKVKHAIDLMDDVREELEIDKRVYAKARIKERLKEIEAIKKALLLEEDGLNRLLGMTVQEIYEESL